MGTCCKPITLTLESAGCPPPILDDVAVLTAASPIAPHRPGCFYKPYTLHLTAGQFIFIRLYSYNDSLIGAFCNPPVGSVAFPCGNCGPYLYVTDSGGNVIAEIFARSMAACAFGLLVEIEDDYTLECTHDCPGVTSTIRTTVTSCADCFWVDNSGSTGNFGQVEFVAPQSVAPLTWEFLADFPGSSLPNGVIFDTSSVFPVQGKTLFQLQQGEHGVGNPIDFIFREFSIKVTDANGLVRKQRALFKPLGFLGYTSPNFKLSPPIASPFSFQPTISGGVPPYTLMEIDPPPHGITMDYSTGLMSGNAVGDDFPKVSNFHIIDSQGDFGSVGINWDVCSGQFPIGSLTWTVTPTTPIPPGDFVTGSIAGGDGAFDLQNIYPGFGPCVANPTRVELRATLCAPFPGTPLDVEMTVRFTGTGPNSDVPCPIPGLAKLQTDIQGFGFSPGITLDVTSAYDFEQVFNITVFPGERLRIAMLISVTYCDCHLVVTLRPL